MSGRDDALRAIRRAWESHDVNGVVRLTMREAKLIHDALATTPDAAPASEARGDGWFLPAARINDIVRASVERQIKRCKQAHCVDLDIRINGQNEHEEADWIKYMVHVAAAPKPAAETAARALYAIRLLVAGGFVTEAKANDALSIAHGFASVPLEPAAETGSTGAEKSDCGACPSPVGCDVGCCRHGLDNSPAQDAAHGGRHG